MKNKPPIVIIEGENPGEIVLHPTMELNTHDRAEYIIGCVLVFSNKRYILVERTPAGDPNPGKGNPVKIKLRRDWMPRKLRRKRK